MFLSKNSKGIYYIHYVQANGKRSAKSTGKIYKKDALNFLVKFQRELEEKASQKFTPIDLKTYRFNFLRYSEPFYTPKTMKVYKTTFKFLLEYFGEHTQLSDLTTVKLEEYLHYRLRKTSVFAARRDLANLSCAFNKAVRDGYLLTNPTRGIRKFKLPEKQPNFYSREDLKKLYDAINETDIKDLVIVAVNTGMRQMELLTLEWRQVDFNEKLLFLDNQSHITKGKRVRSIPINQKCMEVLQRRSGISKQSFVFTYRGEQIKQEFITKYFKRFVIAAGINPKLNFHSLRHAFATYLIQKNVSLYIVSNLLGHADIRTTQIYSHVRREDLRNATDLLD